jgi:putative membrane protein
MKNFSATMLLLATSGPAMADPLREGWHDHMMFGDSYGYGFGGFGMMFLVWATLIVAAVLVWRLVTHGKAGPTADSAMEVLRQRLAKGDIDPEEYEARRKVLEG